MMIHRRGVLRGAAVIGASLVAASCARIPTETDVQQRELDGGAVRDAPYVQPRPPVDGATPKEILEGFVQAGVGPEGDYAVARQYLAPGSRDDWSPTIGVTVYPASEEPEVTETDEDSVRLTVQALSQIDERGVETFLGTPSAREIDISLEQVEGQWRIVDPPDGIFLSQAAFETLFTPALLYFLDPRFRHLVPDHRWFPLQDSPRVLLRQLMTGPAEWLAEAVRNSVPALEGIEEVEVGAGEDSTSEIPLPASLDSLPAEQRGRALAQIQASLSSLPALSGVRLTLGGTAVESVPSGELAQPLPGHRPIGAGRTGVISLADGGAGEAAAQLVPEMREETVSSPTISQTTPLAAALSTDGGTVIIASTDGSVPRRDAAIGGALVPPRADDAGYVWTSPTSNAGALLALAGSGAAADAQVAAPWLAGRDIRALDISADATRMLVLSSESGSTRVDLCGVVRDGDGVPSALTDPRILQTGREDVTQLSWYDQAAVLVLGSEPETTELQVVVLDLLQGVDVMPSPPPETWRIAGSAVSEVVWAATGTGVLLRTNGTEWSTVDLPARDPAFY